MGLKYHSYMKDAPVSDLLIQDSIKNENQFIDFSDSSWNYCPDTGRSTGAHIIFYQGGPIYHGKHVPVPVAQPSAESEYNAAYNSGMALAHFRILINELFKKDPNTFPEVAPLIILNRKSDGCMSNDGKGKNYTRQISRRVHFVRYGDNF